MKNSDINLNLIREAYTRLMVVFSIALEENRFDNFHKATLFKYPVLLGSFMEAFPEKIDIALNLPESHNFLTMAARNEIFLEQLKIILKDQIFRSALLDRPGGEEGWTALQWAWNSKNFPALIELLKYNPKMDAETFIDIVESKHTEITPQLKESLKEQYSHLTKATVTIQTLIKSYLEHKHFLTVKPGALTPRQHEGGGEVASAASIRPKERIFVS